MKDLPFKRNTVLSNAESKALDARTMAELHFSGDTLMEIAGFQAARFIHNMTGQGSALIIYGKGNNGGDALVVARHLFELGYKVVALPAFPDSTLSAETDLNLRRLRILQQSGTESGNKICFIKVEEMDKLTPINFVIDGVFGTGFSGKKIPQHISNLFESVKKTYPNAPFFAMDVPSGVSGDDGQAIDDTVNATATFAFGTLKFAHVFPRGRNRCGRVYLCPLPFPKQWMPKQSFSVKYESGRDYSLDLVGNHKYKRGLVYVIGGSEGISGAAVMAAKAAFETGIGAVHLIVPKGLQSVVDSLCPELIKSFIGQPTDYLFRQHHSEEVQEIISKRPGIALIGPGIGKQDTTQTFIHHLLRTNHIDRWVVDADAVSAYAQMDLSPDSNTMILTPHPGEMAAFGSFDATNANQRMEIAKKAAAKNGMFVLSKGSPTMLVDASGEVNILNYETQDFSRIGFGDILAGTIAAFCSQCPEFELKNGILKAALNLKSRHEQLKRRVKHPKPSDFVHSAFS